MEHKTWSRSSKKFLLPVLLYVVLVSLFFHASILRANAQQLGASLYILPPQINPDVGDNFTLTIKVDSLETQINAIKGFLQFNKDRLEIISVSKIGSLLNLWVEEPQFSNKEGTLRFQGGLPKPGFIGNGGTVLLVIVRAKVSGPINLTWQDAEVLAADGKGTNILSNIQNLNLSIEESAASKESVASESKRESDNFLVLWNVMLTALFILLVLFLFGRWFLRYHDRHAHQISNPSNPENNRKTNTETETERERERGGGE